MITSYLLDGKFKEEQHGDFRALRESVDFHRRKLWDLGLDVIIALFDELGKKLLASKTILLLPGIGYLALWLRKENLERICDLNFLGQSYHERFTLAGGSNIELAAVPRGVVCHWVADNVPTLAFFSIVQAVLSKNASLVKISEANRGTLLQILNIFAEVKIKIGGESYAGSDILLSVALVSFDSGERKLSESFSLSADSRIVWGGAGAVKAITALPQREHCDTIIFGPKYSFGVFDKEYIESAHFERALGHAVEDVAIFNQAACSSPHVFFFEKSRYPLKVIAAMMKAAFENLPTRLLQQNMSQGLATRVINERGRYLLAEGRNIVKSDDLGWTILINGDFCLEEPVQGKCVFIKEVDTVESVLDLVTRKIQVVSAAILDQTRLENFAWQAAYRGVDRIMPPGQMHNFNLPWDGILALNRLVRWVVLKRQ